MKRASIISFLPAVVAAAGITLASSAFSPTYAYTITKNTNGSARGTTYDIALNKGDIGRTLDPMYWTIAETSPDVTAKALITVANFTESSLLLDFTITNTTPSDFQAALVSFAFGATPDVTATFYDKGTVFDLASSTSQFTDGFKQMDVCVYSSNNCTGGDIKDGLQSGGSSDTFQLLLTGNFGSEPEVTLSSFAAKFQTQSGSYTTAGVPEPITMVGSGLALGFGALFKKEASKKRKKAVVKS